MDRDIQGQETLGFWVGIPDIQARRSVTAGPTKLHLSQRLTRRCAKLTSSVAGMMSVAWCVLPLPVRR